MWWEITICICFPTKRRAITLTAIGANSARSAVMTVKMILFGIHVSSDISMICITHPYLRTHEYTLLNKAKQPRQQAPCTLLMGTQPADYGEWKPPFTWHSLDHTYNTAPTWGPKARKNMDKLQFIQTVMGQVKSNSGSSLFNFRRDGFQFT